MNKLQIAALAASVVLATGSVLAQDEAEMPSFSPIETYTCNYNDGMGPDDLDAAVDAWNTFMDENGSTDYFAATIVPIYFGPDTFDFGWLGAYSSGTAMGMGSDDWYAKGGEYAAKFAAVADCDTHAGFASTMVKDPGDNDEEGDNSFVLTFSDCSITTEGDEDILGVIGQWSAFATERGYKNGAWVLFPVYGGGGAEYDFKMVNSYNNFSDMGTNWDLYAEGDYVKAGELNPDLYDCDDSRVYAATVRRRMAEDD